VSNFRIQKGQIADKQQRLLKNEVDRFFEIQSRISRLESEARDILSTARARSKEFNLDFNPADLNICLELKNELEVKLEDFVEIHPRRLLESKMYSDYKIFRTVNLNHLVKSSRKDQAP